MSVPFDVEDIIYLISKTSYLKEEVIGTEPSPPSVSVSCIDSLVLFLAYG